MINLKIMKKIAILFEINCMAKQNEKYSRYYYYLKEELICELVILIKNNETDFDVFTSKTENIIYFEYNDSFQSSYHFFSEEITELEEEYKLIDSEKKWIGHVNDINPFNPFLNISEITRDYLIKVEQ